MNNRVMLLVKKMKIIIFTFIMLTVLTSCDCFQNVKGNVIDATTNQPIQNAHIQKLNKEYVQTNTDQKGEFSIESITGGLFGCPPMSIVISKKGYKTQTIKIDNGGFETIKLKRTID